MDHKTVFSELSSYTPPETGCLEENLLQSAILEKLCWVLANKLYPMIDFGTCPLFFNKGKWSGFDCENGKLDGEFLTHLSLEYSPLSNIIQKCFSCYWETDYMPCILYDEDCMSGVPAEREEEILETVFNGFFEKSAIDFFVAKVIDSPLDYFSHRDYFNEETCLLLKSRLLPFYIQVYDQVKEEQPDICASIEAAIYEIKHSTDGGCIAVLEKGFDASYFVLFDGLNSEYAEGGTLYISPVLLIAGSIIDEGILALDAIYHFLPQELKGGLKNDR